MQISLCLCLPSYCRSWWLLYAVRRLPMRSLLIFLKMRVGVKLKRLQSSPILGFGRKINSLIKTSLSELSSDAQRTLLVNLDSHDLKPEGWDELADEKPDILSFSDISIYELHVRDFSAGDHTVPAHLRGCYLAFTSQDCGSRRSKL